MKWWDVTVTAMCDAEGKPEKLLIVSREISEHVAAEERV